MLNLLTGDVIFFDGHGPVQSSVKFFQKPKTVDGKAFSHVAMALGTAGFVFSSDWKVSINTLNWMLENKYDSAVVMRNKGLFRYKKNRKAWFDFVLDRFKANYDWLQIIGFFLWYITGKKWFARHIQFNEIEVCSTLVWVFLDAARQPLGEDKYVSPNRLFELMLVSDKWEEVSDITGG